MRKTTLIILAAIVGFGIFGFTAYSGKHASANKYENFVSDSVNIFDNYQRDFYLKAAGITSISGNYTNGFTFTSTEVDGSVSNEIQTLSFGSGDLTISGGNTVNIKTPVPYTGTTNGSGVYTITYPSAYASTPNVQAIFQTSDPRDVIMLTASSTTGCSFTVQRRVDVVGLLPSYVSRSGVTVNALVTPY